MMHSKKPNLTTRLVEQLKERISSGEIAAGEKLPSENTLIAEHGVSRTVVREAITRLQAEGLVHTRRGAGSFALTPPLSLQDEPRLPVPRTVAERRHLIEYRLGFETEAAANAALHRRTEDLQTMDSALAGFEAASGNASLSMGCDYQFHLAVAHATYNPYFSRAVQDFGPAMIAMPRRRLDAAGAIDAQRLSSVAAEHRTIRDAIASGDAQTAWAAMRMHLVNSISRLQAESGEGTKSAP